MGATPDEGGTRATTVTVGGEKALPFMHFEAASAKQAGGGDRDPDRRPDDWSPLLIETWGEVVDDPAAWAKAAEEAGADLMQLTLEPDRRGWQRNDPRRGRSDRQGCPGSQRLAAHRLWSGTGRNGQ